MSGRIGRISISTENGKNPALFRQCSGHGFGEVKIRHAGAGRHPGGGAVSVIPLGNGIQVTGKESTGEFRKEKYLWQTRIF